MNSSITTRTYAAQSHYYIQGHPAISGDLFLDEQDYTVFLALLKRYLRSTLRGRLQLLAYCLMPHDFYLCVYQRDSRALPYFLQLVSVAYSNYFNRRHKLPGPLYRQHYRASLVAKPAHLIPISRYIHRLPAGYSTWQWSSLSHYTGEKRADWVRPDTVLRSCPLYANYVHGKRPGPVRSHLPEPVSGRRNQ